MNNSKMENIINNPSAVLRNSDWPLPHIPGFSDHFFSDVCAELCLNAKEFISIVSSEGKFIYVNPSYNKLGYTAKDLIDQNFVDFIHPDNADLIYPLFNKDRSNKSKIQKDRILHYRLMERSGDWTEMESSVSYLKNTKKYALLFVSTGNKKSTATATKEKITLQKFAEEENKCLAAILKESPYPVLTSDQEGQIIYKNPAAESIISGLGLDSPNSFLPENHNELAINCVKDNMTFHNIELKIKGHVFSWTYNPMSEMGIIYLHGIDITEQKHLEEKLVHDTLHDKLTGLPNRSFFFNELIRSIKISNRRNEFKFAVLFMDLGRFKAINDTMGHFIGDKVLVEVSRRIVSCLRPEDTAARHGGDEFTILLNNLTDKDDHIRIVDRLLKNISLPLYIEGHEIFPSASIGIVQSSPDYLKAEDIIRDANTAMYAAKALGESKYVIFDKSMSKKKTELTDFESRVQNAFEKNELCLYYQPIISLSDGNITGFEALIRWKHPKRGLIPPDEFIPPLEETGQIIPIGEWVLRTACGQLRLWHKKFPAKQHLSMSVNLSAKQFTQPDFLDKISYILQNENLYPGYLNLDVTESIIVANNKKTNSTISALQKTGIQISIDDFGIAYSSLSNLNRFNIQKLKIDRSFIKGITDKEWTSIIPSTIISLARHLKMDVIAEGVESKEQLNQLKNLGCGYAQGNLFSPPVDSDNAESLIKNSVNFFQK